MLRSHVFGCLIRVCHRLRACNFYLVLGLVGCTDAPFHQSVSKEIQTYNYRALLDGAPSGSNSLDIYLCDSPNSSPCPTLVYVHGGGLIRGSKENVGLIAKHFNKQGRCFVSVAYPVYNRVVKGVLDQQIASVAQASEWLSANLASHTRRCTMRDSTLMGHSAGAYLASVLATSSSYDKAVRDYKKYVFNDSAWYDPLDLSVGPKSSTYHSQNCYACSTALRRYASQLGIPTAWLQGRRGTRDHGIRLNNTERRIAGFETALGVSAPYSLEERKRVESVSPLYLATTNCHNDSDLGRYALILVNGHRDYSGLEVIARFASGLQECKKINVLVERHVFTHDQMRLQVANPEASVGASVDHFLDDTD